MEEFKIELLNHYEKLYFHEMEVKEKIIPRVQLNFAFLATIFTVVIYMVRMVDYSESFKFIVLFYISIGIFIFISYFSVSNLIRAFWGYEYKGLPTPDETEDYKFKLEQHNKEITKYNEKYPNNQQDLNRVQELVSNYLYNQFKGCATFNAYVNDSRSVFIHQSIKWIFFSLVPFIFCCIFFLIGDLDSSSPQKKQALSEKSESSHLLIDLNQRLKTLENTAKLNQQNQRIYDLWVSQKIELHHLHLQLQRRLNQDELLKVNNLEKGNRDMSDSKPADQKPAPAPPSRPQEPASRLIKNNDEKIVKK